MTWQERDAEWKEDNLAVLKKIDTLSADSFLRIALVNRFVELELARIEVKMAHTAQETHAT